MVLIFVAGSSALNGSSLQGSSAAINSYNSSANRGAASVSLLQMQANTQYPSLKDLFQNSDSLWRPIFGSFVGTNKKPQFAIFRKPIERRGEIPGIKKDTELSKSMVVYHFVDLKSLR